MNRDGAQNAKAEVFEDVFGFKAAARPRTAGNDSPAFTAMPGTVPHRDIVTGRKKKRRDPRDLIALGVLQPDGGNRNPDELKLGIFVQRADLRQHPLVERAIRVARGEVQIIYTGKVVRRSSDPRVCRPLLLGASIGHFRVTAGTIGCFCRHRGSGGIGILSNNHVLADSNRAIRGDIILQPGPRDGGRRNDAASRVATLYEYVPIGFEAEARNRLDCAFATLVGNVSCAPLAAAHPCGENPPLPIDRPVVEADVGDAVRKLGRTTDCTSGIVTGIEIDNLNVAMALGNGEKIARFDGQISIESAQEPFSKGGDSGALIYTRTGPAALLFAGTDTGGRFKHGVTFANPLSAVLEALDLEIHTGA